MPILLADIGIGLSPTFGQGVILVFLSALVTLAVDVLRRWIYRKIDDRPPDRRSQEGDSDDDDE